MTDELSDTDLEEILERRFTHTIVSSCVDVPALVEALKSERTRTRELRELLTEAFRDGMHSELRVDVEKALGLDIWEAS